MSELERRSKFLPAFFVDVVDRGTQYQPEGLPLHLSLFPPLNVPYHQDYGVAMKRLLNPLPVVDIVVGEDDSFGTHREVPVKRIERSPELERVHAELVRVLGHLFHDSTYRQPYNPHISIDSSAQLERGDRLTFGGFAIVSKIGSEPWIVRDKIGFERARDEG